MRSEIIAIGTELLLGAIVDTNTPYIARKLNSIGLDVLYTSAVGDNEGRIADAIRYGLQRSGVVITTGGLGPTVDDMTREAVARATDRPLIFDEALLAQIEERFRRWGRKMSDNNRRQAYRPAGSIAVENQVGTAPAFIVETGESVVISLPGVPREMEYLLEKSVLPYLRQRFNLRGLIKSRVLRVAGLGESMVDQHVGDLEKLTNPTVGLNAHFGVVDVRITAKAESEAEADKMITEVERAARERLGDAIFGVDDETLEGVVLAMLQACGKRVAVVEGGTSGRLAAKLAEADAGRGIFCGGLIKPVAEMASIDIESFAKSVAEEFSTTYGLACVVISKDADTHVTVGLWRSNGGAHWQRGFGGHLALAAEWASTMALNALRATLLEKT